MRLLYISIFCLFVGLANSRMCPDGILCNGGVCCPRILSRFYRMVSFECCMEGFACGFRGGCHVVPKKEQTGPDSVMDRNNFIPPSQPKDSSSIESTFDSADEIADFQMGFIKKIWKKVRDKFVKPVKELAKEIIKDKVRGFIG